MGGLVAMGFALAYPEITEKIVVVDVAPRMYPLDHE
jgi:pimeloyl-ACP methyl ester carboxylesterase